jgi:hypothetical protein
MNKDLILTQLLFTIAELTYHNTEYFMTLDTVKKNINMSELVFNKYCKIAHDYNFIEFDNHNILVKLTNSGLSYVKDKISQTSFNL